ncbi:MAG: arginine--tRNA ligase [bacterium]
MSVLDKIKKEIIERVNKALGSEAVRQDNFVYPPDSQMGDLSLPCFDLAVELKKNPAEVASNLACVIKKDDIISSVGSVGPYFNIFVNREYLMEEVLKEIKNKKNKYGHSKSKQGKRVVVEYGQPNPFKAFHVGHLRNIILGESLVRIFEAQGAKVIRVNYQGDVGMHIAKCLWAFQKIKKEDYPKTADKKVALLGKCYADGAAVFENEKEQEEIKKINKKIYDKSDKEINKLWETGKAWSLEKFYEIYARVYSHFDREYMESEIIGDCMKYIKEARERKILEDSNGAVIFNGEKYGLDSRVFLNSEGLPTYEGKELGLAHKEFTDFGKIDLCIHNVAVEQISFFKVTFKVEELLNEKMFRGKQYHNAYEFVGLKKGKMSSRQGNVLLGNDILNEARDKIKDLIKDKIEIGDQEVAAEAIGVGAVKYAFLKMSPLKYLAFDMEESVRMEGNSGPYIQYSYVRIQSILKKSGFKVNIFKKIKLDELKNEKEYELAFHLARFPEITAMAGKNYDPSEIVKYLFDLCRAFNDYYHVVPVLKAEEDLTRARLVLLRGVAQVIKNGLDLLGIKTVERM